MYRDEALQILSEFENGTVKNALEELVRYTTDRKY
jgi:octaprenyl-diphosphate synthase